MRKLLVLLLTVVVAGCSFGHSNKDALPKDDIDFVIAYFADDLLTPEEIAMWDSLNLNGGHLLIRESSRNFDTIVNHIHLVFTTEPAIKMEP